MTSAPVNKVPATFSPNATISDTSIRNIKLILFTDMFIDLARSLDKVLMTRPRLIYEIKKMMPVTEITVINKSTLSTEDISPNSVSSNSGSGVMSKPIAKLNVKNIPTSASDGSSVFLSNAHIPTVAKNSAAKAPKKGLKPQSNAKAIPGKAT